MISADFSHPMLASCRAFMYPISPAADIGWVNLSPLWVIPVQNGLDSASAWGQMTGAHGAIKVGAYSPLGTSAAYYSYWNDIWPTDDVRDFTVIARICYRGGDPGSGAGGFVAGARGSGNNGGFLFGVWDAGGSDEGLACFLYSGSGVKVFTDQKGWSGLTNYPTVAAFTFEAGVGRFTMYRDGAVTRQTTDTSSAFTPYVNQAGKQLTIGRADVGFAFNGEIGWVAVFARCLSQDEIVAFGRDSEWPFVWDDCTYILEDTSYTFTTTVGVGVSFSVTGGDGVEYTNSVLCSCLIDGDLIAGPQPPSTATYTTTVGVSSRMFGSEPTLVRYTTVVGASSVYSPVAPVQYTTTVYVSSRARGLVDGRADLIGTSRYRR